MAKHLLTCECGRELEVDTGLAGDTIACACGKTISVPTLRQLRELPVANAPAAVSTGPAWGAQQGGIVAALIVAAACLAVAVYSRYSQPTLPRFDPAVRTHAVNQAVDKMTPLEAWRTWADNYRSLGLVGLQEFRHPAMDALEQEVRWHQLVQMVMLGIAALALGIAGIVAITKTGRQGDKGTGRA